MNRMMLDWSKTTNEDLIVLIQNTANKMKIQETVVEKDYWVCFIRTFPMSKTIQSHRNCTASAL